MTDKTDNHKNWFMKHKILSVILGIVALGIIGSAASGSSSPSPTSASNDSSSNTNSKSNATKSVTASTSTPKLNQPADDGSFQFTVTSFNCKLPQVEATDGSGDASTSGAPYCVMGLTVKNIKTTAESFDDSVQYLYSAGGKQFSVDDDATITLEPESSTFSELPTINPGVSMSGQLVYDVPANVTPTYAMLHDSSLSNGVRVNLQ